MHGIHLYNGGLLQVLILVTLGMLGVMGLDTEESPSSRSVDVAVADLWVS